MSTRNTTNNNRRIMTSAIDNMSVAEVRKFLGECRKKHTIQTPEHPMYITDVLANGMQLQEFALKFQQGHHQKRHNKSRKHTQGEYDSDDSDDDYYDEYNTSDSEDDRNSVSPSTPKQKPGSCKNPTPQTHLSTSISNTLASVINKKRGRPKKETPPPKPDNPRSENHSRSLLDFVKKPTKRTKV